MKDIISAVLGAMVALLISQILLHGSVYSLIPWGIVALVLGYFSKTRKEAIVNGAVYGFIISFVFMWLGYQGVAPIVSRIPFFAALGLIGALCGVILCFISFFVKKLFNKRK